MQSSEKAFNRPKIFFKVQEKLSIGQKLSLELKESFRQAKNFLKFRKGFDRSNVSFRAQRQVSTGYKSL